jgi:hypothetical protein
MQQPTLESRTKYALTSELAALEQLQRFGLELTPFALKRMEMLKKKFAIKNSSGDTQSESL